MCANKNNKNEMHDAKQSVKRSKRSKIVLIFLTIILIAGLVALGYLGWYVYNDAETKKSAAQARIAEAASTGNGVLGQNVDDTTAPGEIEIDSINIPKLTMLFGKNAQEAASELGSGFKLDSLKEATDDTNDKIKQLAIFKYTPTVNNLSEKNASISLPTASVYASLDESGAVVDVFFTSDMLLLGYSAVSFDELLGTDRAVMDALAAAGTAPKNFEFAAPGEDATIYNNKESANRKIVKQTQIYSGRTTGESAPTVWTLTFQYDYGLSGVSSAGDFKQATRTLNIRLA